METTFTISDFFETCSPVESEAGRAVSFSTTEISEVNGFKKTDRQGHNTLSLMRANTRYLSGNPGIVLLACDLFSPSTSSHQLTSYTAKSCIAR